MNGRKQELKGKTNAQAMYLYTAMTQKTHALRKSKMTLKDSTSHCGKKEKIDANFTRKGSTLGASIALMNLTRAVGSLFACNHQQLASVQHQTPLQASWLQVLKGCGGTLEEHTCFSQELARRH
jgi:hypothetical protein